ncbi:hypothetical protein F5Y13DRAFT_200748 [Hypoxylon sp. FL1857]|nr:hypothetical protein F5Y13DRAFT_200748 [Hypoxylon sp. FL1857]
MAPVLTFPIYIGVWTNWSQGKVMGARLTLTRNDAQLLIALVAFYVTLVTSCIWNIACFVFHHVYSTSEPQDAVYHQRQVLLRNSTGMVSSLWNFVQLLFIWKPRAKGLKRRLFPLIGYTGLLAVGSAATAALSSMVAVDSEVLLSGSGCGVQGKSGSPTDEKSIIYPRLSEDLSDAAIYGRRCYSQTTTFNPVDCGPYVKDKLLSNVYTNATCPLASGLCRHESANVLLDTGLIDSHNDLGLNAPIQERFLFRKRLHCAPVTTEGHTAKFNISQDRSYTAYLYGYTKHSNFPYNENCTFYASNDAYHDQFIANGTINQAGYSINVFSTTFQSGNPLTHVLPIPEFIKNDTDVFLLFLSANGLLFTNITTDSWYEATEIASPCGSCQDSLMYRQNEPASLLVCSEQYQICNPNIMGSSGCTPLLSISDLFNQSLSLYNDHSSKVRLKWLSNIIGQSWSAPAAVAFLQARSLTARTSMIGHFQGPLAPNQWQLDVQHWHAITMASLQRAFVHVAAGPSDPKMVPFTRFPKLAEEYALCRNQKIKSHAHVSFSLFGLLFTFLFGGIIIAISLGMENLVAYIQRRFELNPYTQIEWNANGVLQLQRMAREERGLGTWTHGVGPMPTTEDDVLLGLTDKKHPRLQRSNLGVDSNTFLSESTFNDVDLSEALQSGAYLDCRSLSSETIGGRPSCSITDEEL